MAMTWSPEDDVQARGRVASSPREGAHYLLDESGKILRRVRVVEYPISWGCARSPCPERTFAICCGPAGSCDVYRVYEEL